MQKGETKRERRHKGSNSEYHCYPIVDTNAIRYASNQLWTWVLIWVGASNHNRRYCSERPEYSVQH